VLLDAHQQWTLAKLMARRARTLQAGDDRDRVMSRAMAFAMLVRFQWKNPTDSQTARSPCPPETLTAMGFPTIAAALTPSGPRPGA
jgi:hypothetical protein